ncbi:hypothetical protein AJ85_09790 [Alkalihalobacillus alcalophilus ATCC 27647 = CGMCC 1.3604]|uniref:Flagellar hook-length control protein-like C-terminal domain-containing protein n=1 Tax=Alkalihalobacillus alcalophilus ATCC 27647 = CGMCC 1.3604 TaxID=1218173 RepID=A0A094XBD2_ALKAL|nr:hypothetical protein [Alkalihalobacillus alcalophilus]KGA96115.1 hypothetical protein BALCAV_0218160 [Alkalihalobacillus alcalophilus ATCC 27647 = CGMCC 1.3604]MED1563398.1 hypothetical protein [Alkalihalobacillus alcalophilus]THG90601.1 hypothetical protein AJ85_09790 [Alkalihalobacillus alcalophilus ATCC 27647 = CGMCC 1.3604]
MFQSIFTNQNVTTQSSSFKPSLAFRQGQLMKGQVTKLFPNNIATLSLNGVTVTAKLELGLTVGQTYWFEVLKSKGLPTLRPFIQAGAKEKGQDGEFLEKLGLQAKGKAQTLLQTLQKQSIPFTRQSFLNALSLLNRQNEIGPISIEHVSRMLQQNWPLTAAGYSAFVELDSSEAIGNKISTLYQSLQQHSSEAIKELEANLAKFINGIQREPNNPFALRLFQSFLLEEAGTPLQLGAKQLLERVSGQTLDVERLVQRVATDLLSSSLIKHEQLTPREQIHSFLQQDQLKISETTESVARVLFQRQLSTDELNWTTLFSRSNLTENEQVVLRQLLDSSWKGLVSPTENRPAFSSQLQQIFQLLGLQHEAELARTAAINTNDFASLKAVLLKARGEELPSQVQTAISRLISHLTGIQVLAAIEQHDPNINHLSMSYPVLIGKEQCNLDLQWQGKRLEDGSLDPEHCRILFYLDLKALDETIVDVQVQSKKVTMTIYNDHKKPNHLISLLIPTLQERFGQFGYQLQTLYWKQNIEHQAQLNRAEQEKWQDYSSYKGVDIRV